MSLQQNINYQKIALIYDFDGTLIDKYMQEYGLINSLSTKEDNFTDPNNFWYKVNKFNKDHQMDRTISYMYCLINYYKKKYNTSFKRNWLELHSKNIEYFPGLIKSQNTDSFFNKINNYAKSLNIILTHHIVSLGIEEMMKSSKISKYFRKDLDNIWGAKYYYDDLGYAVGPSVAPSNIGKCEYLFRINKGIIPYGRSEDFKMNEYTILSKRNIPYNHIIYLGDGETDIPFMKMVKYKGGKSIAVFNNQTSTKEYKNYHEMKLQDRIQEYFPADYREDSPLYNYIKNFIKHIYNRYNI